MNDNPPIVGRRAVLLGSGLLAGGAVAGELLGASAAAGAKLGGPTVVADVFTSAAINDAIKSLPPTGGVIELLAGTYAISTTVLVPDNVALIGAGRGVSILRLVPGANVRVVGNANLVSGNTNITLRGFTVDGNRTAQRPGALQGIEMHQCAFAHLDDLEIHDCSGTGLWFSGDGKVVRVAVLSNIECHDNTLDGMNVTWAAREVHYTAITCDLNGRDGCLIDHSDSVVTGITATRNVRDGIRIHNVFNDSFVGFNANLNGRNGIRVSGCVDSTGAAWNAHSNGQREAASDVYFDGMTSTYGLTNQVVITGIECGPVSKSTWGTPWPPPSTATMTYGLQVDPLIVGSLALLGVRSSGGKFGPYSLPPASAASKLVVLALPVGAGELQLVRGNLAVTTGNLTHAAKSAKVGFYGAPAVTRPVVNGSRANGAALQSLLKALAALGLVTDKTT